MFLSKNVCFSSVSKLGMASIIFHCILQGNSVPLYFIRKNSIRIYVFIRNAVDLDVSMVNRTERSEGEFKELTHLTFPAHCILWNSRWLFPCLTASGGGLGGSCRLPPFSKGGNETYIKFVGCMVLFV